MGKKPKQTITALLERGATLTIAQRVPVTVDIRRVLELVPDEMLLDEVKFRGLELHEA